MYILKSSLQCDGGGVLGRWVRQEGGALMMGLVPLWDEAMEASPPSVHYMKMPWGAGHLQTRRELSPEPSHAANVTWPWTCRPQNSEKYMSVVDKLLHSHLLVHSSPHGQRPKPRPPAKWPQACGGVLARGVLAGENIGGLLWRSAWCVGQRLQPGYRNPHPCRLSLTLGITWATQGEFKEP